MNAAHRLISHDFRHDLTDANGILLPVLSLVKADDTLSLSIRSGYINVYYRGGSLAKIRDLGGHSYRFEFDGNYLRSSHHSLLSANLGTSPGPPVVRCAADAAAWVSRIPQTKFAMDLWFGEHPKQEREYQQLVERTNNANYATDYFVCDIEYTNPDCPELRADLVALHWPSTREARKQATEPERVVRSVLHQMGYRFRLHVKGLPGKPDIVLPRYKTVIFIHGCFWHRHPGCKYAYTPKSRPDFWEQKFTANVERHRVVSQQLEDLGWRVIVIWECEIRDIQSLREMLRHLI